MLDTDKLKRISKEGLSNDEYSALIKDPSLMSHEDVHYLIAYVQFLRILSDKAIAGLDELTMYNEPGLARQILEEIMPLRSIK